ncbi:surface protease GP63 [Trypanosoma cruzi]|nr:surface protease GP63 [Trypanosoma cruzi]
MHIAVDLNASFAVHAGSCVWRLLSSSVAMRRREGEGVRSSSLLSCGCNAPRVTALSWAPCPTEGGMAGNFGAALWMDEGLLARVRCVVGARSVCVVWWPRGFAISLGL